MIIFTLLLISAKGYAIPGTYECGLHGRFEYCIDGFPGCVVGCHCYPGYYFDTESKICEPNTKLTQDFRRHLPPVSYNLPLNSGVHIEHQQPPQQVQLPHQPPPNSNVGDNQDDDLSDWLYNQFFKTIENQVINKTDGDEHLMPKTRRSGGPLEPLTRKRNSRKRKSRKRQRKKDDDTDESASDSSSDSDSSDSDESSSLGSWERYEWDRPKPGKPGKPGTPEDGAHRQIVVYSKKPKPPLPSFIFLPNMNSPYFPPIGLPAPAMPMYPIVPIPPITPPDCVDPTTVTEATSAVTTHLPTTSSPPAPKTSPQIVTTTPPTTKPATSPPLTEEPKKILRSGKFFNTPIRKKSHLNSVHRPYPPSNDYFMNDEYEDFDYNPPHMPNNNLQGLDDDIGIQEAKPNFKYISQLIHRDKNKSTSPAPWKSPSSNRLGQIYNPKTPTPRDQKNRVQIKPDLLGDTRRQFDPRINGQDDSYYSTLGRQIATLIRGIESKGEAGLKNEPAVGPNLAHPFLTESTFSARSYWERFVRSPLNMILKNATKYNSLIASNEELLDLENKVQEVTAEPALSWLELENIINRMRTAPKLKYMKKIQKSKDSNSSLNINLLPGLSQRKAFKNMIKTIENQMHGMKFKDKPSYDSLNISQPLQLNQIPAVLQKPKDKMKDDIVNNVIYNNKLPNELPKNTNVKNKRTRIIEDQRSISNMPSKVIKVKTTKYKDKIDQNRFKYNNNGPVIFEAGGAHFIESKKYFVDGNANTNYYFENWFTK